MYIETPEARTDQAEAAWQLLRTEILDNLLGERNRCSWATARHSRECMERQLWSIAQDADFIEWSWRMLESRFPDDVGRAVKAIYEHQLSMSWSSDSRTRRNHSKKIWREHNPDLSWLLAEWMVG